jgi:hypothetical protein
MSHQVLNQFFNEFIQVDVADSIESKSQTFSDGSDRLVLNGSCHSHLLSMLGTLNFRVPKVLDRGGDSPTLEFRPSMLPRYLKRHDNVTDLIPGCSCTPSRTPSSRTSSGSSSVTVSGASRPRPSPP